MAACIKTTFRYHKSTTTAADHSSLWQTCVFLLYTTICHPQQSGSLSIIIIIITLACTRSWTCKQSLAPSSNTLTTRFCRRPKNGCERFFVQRCTSTEQQMTGRTGTHTIDVHTSYVRVVRTYGRRHHRRSWSMRSRQDLPQLLVLIRFVFWLTCQWHKNLDQHNYTRQNLAPFY